MTDERNCPADGMTQDVDCGDGAWMTIVDPRSFDDGGPEWVMRYGDPEAIRHTVASLIDSYDYLLSGNITLREARRRLSLLRHARIECLLPNPSGDAALASSGHRIPNYCKPCGENLLPEQEECPFCGQEATPIDAPDIAHD